MFLCQITGRTSKPIEKLTKIPVAFRNVEYRHWDYDSEEEWFTHGTEIVREINASEEGLLIWSNLTPEEREEFVKGLG